MPVWLNDLKRELVFIPETLRKRRGQKLRLGAIKKLKTIVRTLKPLQTSKDPIEG